MALTALVGANSSRARPTDVLGFGLAVVFSATILLTVFLPIYQDEIGWKILLARHFLDGGVDISLFPQCGASFAVAPPWFMLPDRLLEAWLYGDLRPPFQLRLFGMASFVTWLGVSLCLIGRSELAASRGVPAGVLLVAFMGLGVLPGLMVINRPEQPVLLGLTVLLLLPLLPAHRSPTLARDIAVGCGLLLLFVLLVSNHPKSLLFLPLVLVSVFLLVERWSVRGGIGLALVYVVLESYVYWTARNECPADALLDSTLKGQLIPLSVILSDFTRSLTRLLENLLASWQWAKNMIFWYRYQAHWLAPTETMGAAAAVVSVLVGLAAVGLAALVVVNALRLLLESWRAKSLTKEALLTGSCLVSLLALALVQGHKNFYETSLVLPLLLLTALLSLPRAPASRTANVLRRSAPVLVLLSIGSQLVLWSLLTVQVPGVLQGGYVPTQPNSFSAFGFDRTASDLAATARMCGIDPTSPPPHVIVDHMSYAVFSSSYRPFHVYYMNQTWNGPLAPEKLLRFLERERAGGLVAGCHLLPESLRARATSNGAYCCLPGFAAAG